MYWAPRSVDGGEQIAEKTQLLWLGTRQQLTNLTISQLHLVTAASSSAAETVSTASNFGVIFDSQLTMSAHISAVCQTGFFQLRQQRTIRRSLTPDSTCALVQAFASCCMDYCSSLLAGVADVHLHRLQSVQNAAARLVSGARRHDHITPIPATLHWLPVHERVTFKTVVLVWKCLHDVAPRYLVDLCVPTAATAGRRQSRSAVSGALMVPWTRTSTGQCNFAVYDPRTWNWLPPALQMPELSLSSFKRQLKTHLFQH